MPSSYTTSLRLTLPANGELAGTWGTTVNNGVTSLAEAAIAGTAAVAMTDADYTLSIANGATDQSRNMFVTLTGTLTAARNVICPAVSKLYFVTNNTTGGYAITFKTLAGAGISVPNGQRAVLYCNGTDVLGGLTALDSLSLNGSLTLTGGTANTVPYLNGSKVVTTGSALAFDGTNLSLGAAPSAWGAGIRGYEVPAGSVWSVSPTSIFLTSNAYYNGTNYIYKTSNAASQYQQGAGAHTWYVAASGTAGATFSFTTAMTLNASGNLGVGTASPNARFTAGGNSSANTVADIQITRSSSGTTIQTGPNITFSDGTTNNTVALQATQGRFGVWNYGGGSWNERLSIDASGNVGLKVTPSAWSSVNYALQGTGGSLFSTGANNVIVGSNVYYDGAYKYVGAFNATLAVQSAGQHQWLTAAVGTAGAAVSWTTAMTLDSSGNLGLGVTPSASWPSGTTAIQFGPSSALYNPGSGSRAVFASNAVFTSGVSSANYITSNAAAFYDQSNGTHSWHTAPSGTAGNAISFTQAMTLDASGNLGIGTNAPGYRLSVAGTAGSAVLNLLETGVRSWAIRAGGAATNTFDISDLTAGQTRLTLDSSGNLGLGVTPSAWISNAKALQIGTFLSAWQGSNGSVNISFGAYEGGAINTYKYSTTGDAPTRYQQLSGAHAWYTAPSGTAGSTITFTQAMTLDASGNLGLGVTPSAWSNYKAVQFGALGNLSYSSGFTVLGTNAYNNGTNWIYQTTNRVVDYYQDIGSGTHVWRNAVSGTAGTTATLTTAMTLDASSNLLLTGYGRFGGSLGYIGKSSDLVTGGAATDTVLRYDGNNLVFAYSSTERARFDSSGNLGVGTTSPVNKLQVNGSFGRTAPVLKSADFTLAATENWVINNKPGSACVATLPAASSWTGREVTFKNVAGFSLDSASSNITQLPGGATQTSIAPAGKWATLVSDGTNWVVVASGTS